LKEFKEKHGHCKVPLKTNKQLNGWVDAQVGVSVLFSADSFFFQNLQRQAHKQGRLSEERQKELEMLGIQWVVKSWESKYAILKQFKQKNGHCNVSVHSEKQIYRWIVDQRRANKKGKLSQERILKLQELGISLTSKRDKC
jgi:hypothetical protein